MLKLLIVEDEPLVLDGLKYTIEWKQHDIEIVGAVSNGLEATSTIEQNNPDIVLSDIKMPGMDGLELAEWIYDRFPDIYIIFLTGYSDFEYARNAMKNGAVDYLLKPVNEEALFKAIKKIRSKIKRKQENEKEHVRLQIILEQNMPFLKEKFIYDILNHEMDTQEIKTKMEFFNIDLIGDLYLIAIAEINSNGSKEEKFLDIELLKIQLSKLISDKFCHVGKIYVFNDKNKSVGIILSLNNNSGITYGKILNILESLREEASRQLSIITIGVSNLHERMESLPVSYKEANAALNSKMYLGKNLVVPSGKLNNSSNNGIFIFNRNDLIRLFLSYNISGIGNWMRGYFEYYKKNSGITDQLIQFVVFELALILVDIINSEGFYNEIQFSFSTLEELTLCETLDELFEKIFNLYNKVMDDVKKLKNRQSRKLIEDIKKYIEKNYMKDITIKTISEEFYMNPSYLSRLFSCETGVPFTDYLIKLRIEKAKVLLNDPRLKIYTVSEMVGYKNEKYFTRVFKKFEGASPYEYKKGY